LVSNSSSTYDVLAKWGESAELEIVLNRIAEAQRTVEDRLSRLFRSLMKGPHSSFSVPAPRREPMGRF
jgi:hypothetical protein